MLTKSQLVDYVNVGKFVKYIDKIVDSKENIPKLRCNFGKLLQLLWCLIQTGGCPPQWDKPS